VIARWLRQGFSRVAGPAVAALARSGLTPNQLTLAGLAMAWIAGGLIVAGWPVAAAVCVLACGLLDALDGELARHGARATPFGAFLDSIADHYGDVAIYLGIAWIGLAGSEPLVVLLVLVAMFGSVAGSHIRSRAGMLGMDTKEVGIFTRAERIVVIAFGLAAGSLAAAMLVLAIGNNLTALQRLVSVLSYEKQKETGER